MIWLFRAGYILHPDLHYQSYVIWWTYGYLLGWWVLKKWLNLAIEVSWLSLKEPECDFISFVCGPVWMVELPVSRRFDRL